jgi:HEAT repeat protein
LDRIAWLEGDDAAILAQFDASEQMAAAALAVASGVRRTRVFQFLAHLLKHGTTRGRHAACAALAGFQGDVANQLILDALADESPEVQCEAARQLRGRAVSGALTRLMALVESPHEDVAKAARESLSEFTVDRYRATFDSLTDQARTVTGGLVRKLDPSLVNGLREDLVSPARSRRLRAVEMAIAANVVDSVERELIACLDDSDYYIRAAAAWALGHSDSPSSRLALTEALADRSVSVQQAARGSLAELSAADEVELPAGNNLTRW